MRYGSLLVALLIAGAGAGTWYWVKSGPPPQTASPGFGKRGAMRVGVVPVSVEAVQKGDVAVYRDGIGNMQSLLTVTVRSQIDGRLQAVEFTEGQMVKKGDLLARIDPVIYKAQYDQAVAKKAQDSATLANARMDLQRYQRLAQTNAGSQQQADQQAAVVKQLEAQVQADQAAIDNAKAFLDYTTILAPIDGRVGLRQVDPGNIIHASDAGGLVSITQIDPIAVVFTLPQRDLTAVTAALAAGPVPVEVLQSGSREIAATGVLQTVDNQVDTSTGTIKLKARFPNPRAALWPGQFVSARVTVETLKDTLIVPTPAVRRGPIGTFVYAIDGEDVARLRKIEVTTQDDVRAVIKGDITAGTRIVTVGFAQLADGKKVRIIPAGGENAAPQTGATSPPGGKQRASGDGGEGRKGDGQKRKSGDAERRREATQ